jgi:hypothetical protein
MEIEKKRRNGCAFIQPVNLHVCAEKIVVTNEYFVRMLEVKLHQFVMMA